MALFFLFKKFDIVHLLFRLVSIGGKMYKEKVIENPNGFFIVDANDQTVADAHASHVSSYSSVKEAQREIKKYPEEYEYGELPYKIIKITKITSIYEYEVAFIYKGKK